MNRLFHKSYLVTVAVFALIFYACILFISASSLRAVTSTVTIAADSEEFAIKTALTNSFLNLPAANRAQLVKNYARYYYPRGVRLAVVAPSGETLFSNLPAGIDPSGASETAQLTFHEPGGERYTLVAELLESGDALYCAHSAEEAFALYDDQRGFLTLLGTLVVLLAAIGLYVLQRRLLRPVDNLAHELRTPLTSISGYAEYLLTANAAEDEKYEALSYIMSESARLAAITDRLLVMANLRDGEIGHKSVNLHEVFIRLHKTYPEVSVPASSPPVLGDEALLGSLFLNLVVNAVKAGASRVVIAADGRRVTVSDNGRGLSPEQLALLNHAPNGISSGGSGLGVPLCHEIARLHGARLTYASDGKTGTVATIDFTSPS